MQIVIDIPDEMYQNVLNGTYCGTLYEELKNGTPLPKGHGRLIDKDGMMADILTIDPQYKKLIDWCLQVTDAQPTIIEADRKL